MPLNPIVSAQPPNFGVGDTFSFITVNDAGRPLFAKAVYLVNPGDISGGGGGVNSSVAITNALALSSVTTTVGISASNTLPVSGNVTLLNSSSALNASVLGLAGFTFTNNTGQVIGNFSTIQVISGAKFAGLTATNSSNANNLSAYELPQGFVLNGPITSYKLNYGAVIAYNL